mmetsp:Transcript_14084/g.17107  ORF Transcript_14084/g.17107 Transcript_14084/m.17107 type:complete len:367 (-) Transcript_14084:112-1212(-)
MEDFDSPDWKTPTCIGTKIDNSHVDHKLDNSLFSSLKTSEKSSTWRTPTHVGTKINDSQEDNKLDDSLFSSLEMDESMNEKKSSNVDDSLQKALREEEWSVSESDQSTRKQLIDYYDESDLSSQLTEPIQNLSNSSTKQQASANVNADEASHNNGLGIKTVLSKETKELKQTLSSLINKIQGVSSENKTDTDLNKTDTGPETFTDTMKIMVQEMMFGHNAAANNNRNDLQARNEMDTGKLVQVRKDHYEKNVEKNLEIDSQNINNEKKIIQKKGRDVKMTISSPMDVILKKGREVTMSSPVDVVSFPLNTSSDGNDDAEIVKAPYSNSNELKALLKSSPRSKIPSISERIAALQIQIDKVNRAKTN